MKICLINPPRLLTLTSVSLKATPPLGLAYIAGALKAAGHDVSVIDAIALAPYTFTSFQGDIVLHGLHDSEVMKLISSDVEIIGLGCMFSNNWLANRRFINSLTSTFPNAKIVLGGEHSTAVPDLCFNQCKDLHAIVLGEGEETMVELAHAIENNIDLATVEGIVYRDNNTGELLRPERRKRVREIETLPWPAWELFPMEKYMEHKFSYGVDRGRSLPIMATRGCPYTCTFCSSPKMWGTRYFMRSPKDMADEIQHLYEEYNIQNFDFYDLTAIVNKRWIVDFCTELAERKLNLTWQIPAGTRSEAIDREVAEWLYKSGCRNITYAPESGSPEVLKMIKKKVHLDKMLESIRYSNQEKLNIKLNMMIGFPDETQSQLWETVWFMAKASWAGAHDALPSIFSPYPGSELFDRLVVEKRVDPYDDAYWVRIIFADDYTKAITYSNHVGKKGLLFYVIIQTLFFYGTNFLFRPIRFLVTVKNLFTKNYESRAEVTFSELVKRNTQIEVREEQAVIQAA